MHSVSKRFKHFVLFLRQNCITNNRIVTNILNKIFDKNFIIEYELEVYV